MYNVLGSSGEYGQARTNNKPPKGELLSRAKIYYYYINDLRSLISTSENSRCELGLFSDFGRVLT